jgi:hypothetical protein
MEKATHYGIGIQQEWNSWLFKLEGFRQHYDDIVVADPYITTAYRERQVMDWQDARTEAHVEQIKHDMINRYEYNARIGWSNDGTGLSEGYEVHIKRTLPPGKNGIYGWISYTWSRSIRNDHQHIIEDNEKDDLVLSADERRILNQYDNTKDHYADFDRTVVATLVIGWKMNREWQVGMKWQYRTAPPYTPIIGSEDPIILSNARYQFAPIYSKLKNSQRAPPYHRMDIRIDRFVNYEWGFGNVFVEVLNVYLKDNPESYSYSQGRPFSRTNPEPVNDFAMLEFPMGNGSKMKVPLFNVGLEVKF